MSDSPFNQDALKGGRTFIKPEQYRDAIAIIVEPVRVNKDVRSTYNGKERVRDEAQVNLTVFQTVESVEKGEPSEVIKAGVLSQVMLVSTIQNLLDSESITLAVLRKIPTTNGSGWVFRPVEDASVVEKVGAFYTAREAAITEAVASAPSFD